MDVDALRIFLDIARTGSFAAAARERGLEPSSLSRAIAGLERSLGFRLLQRSTRRVALSEAGALYLARVQTALDDLETGAEEARALSVGPTGVLRVTASVTFGVTLLAPLVPELRRVEAGRSASGSAWIGLAARHDHIVTGIAGLALLPAWLALPMMLGLLLAAWRREGA